VAPFAVLTSSGLVNSVPPRRTPGGPRQWSIRGCL